MSVHNDYDEFKDLLLTFKEKVCKKIDETELKVEGLNKYCANLEEKLNTALGIISDCTKRITFRNASCSSEDATQSDSMVAVSDGGPNLTFITLNEEEDFPNGSWLGYVDNPEMRVRCKISPSELLHINLTCKTAEKMALTLLDYLFDREVQSCSNISGTGKHKKKQLDPLMIYGIRCHLLHKFNINPIDWNRIKQNLDSKCRTAFRKRQRYCSTNTLDEPLSKRTSSETLQEDSFVDMNLADPSADTSSEGELSDTPEMIDFHLSATSSNVSVLPEELTAIIQNARVIHTEHGDIQVVHATPEQLAEIQQNYQIHILENGQLLSTTIENISEIEPKPEPGEIIFS